ncbi:MAG: cytochrome oxidase small assembly protein [Burkholderiales bacterium]|nr:cytochrome oxidase small assembly protein [Burkholderiales bacterium]
MTAPSTPSQDEIKARNTRLALILASIAATFFIGFMAKMILLAHH